MYLLNVLPEAMLARITLLVEGQICLALYVYNKEGTRRKAQEYISDCNLHEYKICLQDKDVTSREPHAGMSSGARQRSAR